jgi:hypothetical protein
MTAATLTARPAGRGPDGLVLASARLQLVNPWSVAWPWGILASSLAVNLVIWALMSSQTRDQASTGGLASIFVVQALWGFQSVVQMFPFGCGLGLTRRAFALGAGVVHVGQAVLYALGLTGLRYLEAATGGFGLDLEFFRMPLLTRGGPVEQFLTYAALFLLVSAVGLLAGVVHHRWRSGGLFAAVVLAGAAATVVMLLLVGTGWGPGLLDALAGAPSWVPGVLLSEAVASAAALGAFLLLRRAVP